MDATRHAALRGLDIDETWEVLHRDWMRIEGATGNTAGVRKAIARLQRVSRTYDISLEPLTERMIDLVLSESPLQVPVRQPTCNVDYFQSERVKSSTGVASPAVGYRVERVVRAVGPRIPLAVVAARPSRGRSPLSGRRMLMRLRRLVTAALLAATMAGPTAAVASAAPKTDPDENYLTDTKYQAISFGMSRQQVAAVIGTRPHCSGTGSDGPLVCWAKNQFDDQTGSFTFNTADQLTRKEKDYAFAYAWYTRDLPMIMTKAQYEQQFAVGDTLAEVNARIAGTACTDRWVEYPGYPSPSGWKTMIQCTGTVSEAYPDIEFHFTDGVLTHKTYYSRNDPH